MPLIQEKLDVLQKSRSNPFNWRGQFTPEFVDYILGHFSTPETKVLDPFAGSGTLLLECARKNLECEGGEINPAAYAMSKFYTLANLTREGREKIVFDVAAILNSSKALGDRHSTLINLIDGFNLSTIDPLSKLFLINCLMLSENGAAPLNKRVASAFQKLEYMLLALPYSNKQISMHLCDARQIHRRTTDISLVVTSPPYINVFNYHQNFRNILEKLGWDMLTVAQSEFGSNRKNRGNRFKTVIQYAIDMEMNLRSMWECLTSDAKVIMVVGRQSNVRGVPFYNGQIIEDIVRNSSGFEMSDRQKRSFQNRFGENILEDILIFRKIEEEPARYVAKEIAEDHLIRALNVGSSVSSDILAAIKAIPEIEASPLLSNIYKDKYEPHPA